MSKNILALFGAAESGKDTAAKIIQYLTGVKYWEQKTERIIDNPIPYGLDGYEDWVALSPYQIKRFAGKIKEIASLITGVPVSQFEDQEFKKSYLPDNWDRWKIQFTGEHGNAQFGPNYSSKEEAIETEKNARVSYAWPKSLKTVIRKEHMTFRDLLEEIGAKMREVHPMFWINSLFADYKGHTERYHNLEKDGLSEMYHHHSCAECSRSFNGWKRQYRCRECIEKNPVVYPLWLIADGRLPEEAQVVKERGGLVIKIVRETDNPVYESERKLDQVEADYVISNNKNKEDLVKKLRLILIKEGIL
jgi:hypothetical protein